MQKTWFYFLKEKDFNSISSQSHLLGECLTAELLGDEKRNSIFCPRGSDTDIKYSNPCAS